MRIPMRTAVIDAGTRHTGAALQTVLRSLLLLSAWLCWDVGFAFAQPGLAFTFESAADDGDAGNRKVLWMKGEVAEGDFNRLRQFVRSHPEDFIAHGERVVFVVDGGDVAEAIRIGHFLRDALMEAWLPDSARTRCISACFFMFANAVSRIAVAHSVAIHRPYFDADRLVAADPAQVRRRYDSLMREVRESLDALLVPRDLTEKMLRTPWNDAYWLSGEDLERLGQSQAWFEDFSAARCGVEPRLRQRLESAIAAGFALEAQALREDLDGATRCVAELRLRHRRQLIERLTDNPE